MPNVSRLMRVALHGRPVAVEMIDDGRRGLERARKVKPAVILLDLALPGMHGFDVLRELRSAPATASIPVIIVTAQGDSQTALESRRLGADWFVSKPFLLTELRRTVNLFLGQAETAANGASHGDNREVRASASSMWGTTASEPAAPVGWQQAP